MTMTTTTTTNATLPSQQRARLGVRKHSAIRTARIVLAAIFLIAAAPKLAGVQSSVHMFAQMGVGQWLRYFVGAAELAGAIGLLIPRLAGLAAAGLAADMVGATIVNIVVFQSAAVVLTIALGVVCVCAAHNFRREKEISVAVAGR